VAQYAHAPHRRQHIAEQFDALSCQCGSHQRHACNIAARTRQAGNDTGFDRVPRDYYDWDILSCLLCSQSAGDIERYDHIDLEPDKLGGEPSKPI
jgi:hypothetical protein